MRCFASRFVVLAVVLVATGCSSDRLTDLDARRMIEGNTRFAEPRTAVEDGVKVTLAKRRFIAITEITYNREDDPMVARVLYQWAWEPNLRGQLAEVPVEPVNAVASFFRPSGKWMLRDPGF
jgi:hypothetical protein